MIFCNLFASISFYYTFKDSSVRDRLEIIAIFELFKQRVQTNCQFSQSKGLITLAAFTMDRLLELIVRL